MKIVGYTVGTSLPKPDFNQTDPKKGDYIKNKPDFEGLQTTINDVSELVGDKKVSEQIDLALKADTAYFDTEANATGGTSAPLNADTFGGKHPSEYVLNTDISGVYVKASVEEFEYGNAPLTNANLIDGNSINSLFAMLFEVEHPVGSLYLSASSTDNPNTKWSTFGITCTWELVKDVFLLGAGGNYNLGAIGGEAAHTLTAEEIASHRHEALYIDGNPGYEVAAWSADNITTTFGYINSTSGNGAYHIATEYAGGGQPHNNMPPYLVTNIWKRIS